MTRDPGGRLVDLALGSGRCSIAVVGTAKNAGKTVAFGAIVAALGARGVATGVLSIGRDGETHDAVTQAPKPPVRLGAGTLVATARALLPAHPAAEIVELTRERSAVGPVALARLRSATRLQLAGPATADGLRRVARRLAEACEVLVVDGAIDRLAALRGGEEAIVLAVGATGGRSLAEIALGARALARRLSLPPPPPEEPALDLEGALTMASAADLEVRAAGRPVVVEDPTRVLLGGRALLALLERIDLRVRRPLRLVACTVAPSGPGVRFEPRAFLDAVASATGLPTVDVFAASSAGFERAS